MFVLYCVPLRTGIVLSGIYGTRIYDIDSCVYVYELVCSSQSVFPRVLSLQYVRPWLEDPAWSSYSSEQKEVE